MCILLYFVKNAFLSCLQVSNECTFENLKERQPDCIYKKEEKQ